MKKFIVAILAILYLGTSVGATVHLHYCMGKLVDWSLWNNSSSKCSNCGMENSHVASDDGCCKDEYKVFKNDKDQKLTQNASYLLEASFAPHIISRITLPAVHISTVTETNPISHAPPRSQAAIYIRNRVFLI